MSSKENLDLSMNRRKRTFGILWLVLHLSFLILVCIDSWPKDLSPLGAAACLSAAGTLSAWFALRGFRLSSLLLTCALVCSIGEIQLRYGKGELLPALSLLFIIIDSRCWGKNAGSSTTRSSRQLLYSSFLLTWSAAFHWSDIHAAAFPLLILTMFPLMRNLALTEEGYQGIRNGMLFSLFIYLPLSQIQLHEYGYFFLGISEKTPHPQLICGTTLWIAAVFLSALYLLRGKRERIFSLLVIAASLLCLCVMPPMRFSMEMALSHLGALSQFFGSIIPSPDLLIPGRFEPYLREAPLSGLQIVLAQWGVIGVALAILLVGELLPKEKNIQITPLLMRTLAGGVTLLLPGIGSPIFFAMGTACCLFCRGMESPAPALRIFRPVKLALSVIAALIISGACIAYLILRQPPQFPYPSQPVEVPRHFVLLLLSAEDLLFFDHHGIDFARMKTVIEETYRTKTFTRGGSTLTMQLVKVLYLHYEKTLWRKFSQTFRAFVFELTFSKEELLSWYISCIPFAPHTNGVVAASTTYFSKKPVELSFEESLKMVLSVEDPLTFIAQHASTSRGRAVIRNMKAFEPYLDSRISQIPWIKK